ncbi:transposase [Sneathiella sp.]|uniref:transposase n=1 Tax=Sneathiella sp. TaxID=1964365 RepID=UPI0035683C96
MERKTHTQAEVMTILRELADGLSVEEATKKHRISRATLYRWRKRAQATGIEEINRLRQVDQENTRLKHLLAEAALEVQALKEQLRQLGWPKSGGRE